MTDSDAFVISKFRDMGLSTKTDMISREVAFINDSNGQSYNGQIVLDASQLGQTNKWISYGEAYIEIPYVIAAKGNTDWSANFDMNSIFLKDGFHQLIDNISVEFNQKTVVQVQNFQNVHTTFKLLTSCSGEDLYKNGALTGFFTEDVDSYTYSGAPGKQGVGYINNAGTVRKTATTSFDLATVSALFPTLTEDGCLKSGRSYYSKTGDNAARYYYWVVMAQIRLRDITDFFDKIPLCKTTDMRINLSYNSVQFNVQTTVAAGDPAAGGGNLYITNYQQLSGHTNPIMFKISVEFANTTTVPNNYITIRSNIYKHGLAGGTDPTVAINSVRLYVPIYKISDSVSLAMLQNFPTTTFEYNDIYTYVIPSISAGSPFTQILTTGIVDPQYVIVIPYPKTTGIAGLGIADYQSPFSSSPGTSSNIILSDFNVQVAGLNVFQANERYDWEQFSDQLVKINAIDGNNQNGLTSGLLSYDRFQKGFRMYICDLRRREDSDRSVTKSIVVQATNTAGCEIELICFVAYRKSLSINTATGTLAD